MHSPLYQAMQQQGTAGAPAQPVQIDPAEYKRRVDQAAAQMQQQGRNPSAEFEQLYSRYPKAGLDYCRQIGQAVARRFYGGR